MWLVTGFLFVSIFLVTIDRLLLVVVLMLRIMFIVMLTFITMMIVIEEWNENVTMFMIVMC